VLVGATASAAVAACTAAPAPAPSRPAPSRPAPAASGSGPTSATDAGTTDAGTIDAGATGPAPTDPGSTAAAGPSGTDLTVRALRDGLDATSGAVTLRVLGGSAPVVLDDGSVRVAAVDDRAGHDVDSDDGGLVGGSEDGGLVRGSEDVRLVVAVPPPLTIDVLRDGTALVRDGDTPVAGLRADPEGRLRARDAAAVLTAPASSASGLWFTARSILDLSWGDREGGRSLAVTPADWARAGGLAADTLVWAQLSAAEPDARTATMHAQLSCHQLGARDKDTWNLEPWRPHVDAFELVAARCNPT